MMLKKTMFHVYSTTNGKEDERGITIMVDLRTKDIVNTSCRERGS